MRLYNRTEELSKRSPGDITDGQIDMRRGFDSDEGEAANPPPAIFSSEVMAPTAEERERNQNLREKLFPIMKRPLQHSGTTQIDRSST